MTSLAQQLQRLAIPHTQAVFGEDKRKKSLLFDPKEAASLDRETFFALGVNGLEELQTLDITFCDFENNLFSESSQSFERSVQTKEVNDKLDERISEFLLKLSPYCLLKPAHKALEWLIYRYHIHFYNIDSLMMCVLPFHESKVFTRVVQLLSLDSKTATKWDWLLPLQKSGIPLPRLTLINHCRTDPGFLSFVCDFVPKSIKVHTTDTANVDQLRTLFSFYVSTVVGVIETGNVTENIISSLLPHMSYGLRSKFTDYKAATYMIVAQLFFKVKLKEDLVKTLMNAVCKRMSSRLLMEALSCLVLVFQTQNISRMTKRSLKHVCSQSGLVECLQALAEEYKIDSFLEALMNSLIPAAFKQSTETSSGSEVSDSESYVNLPEYLVVLQRLVSSISLNDRLAEDTSRKILENYIKFGNRTNDEEELKVMGNSIKKIVQLLENKYPSAIDSAVKFVSNDPEFSEMKSLVQDFLNLSVLSVQHQHIPDSEDSLTMSLIHRTPEIRVRAVELLLENKAEILDKEFLSESVLSRLADDSAAVVKTVLSVGGKSLWSFVADKKQLVQRLSKLLPLAPSDEESWQEVEDLAIGVLTSCDPLVDEDVILCILPHLLLIKGDEKEISRLDIILKSEIAKRNSVLSHVAKNWNVGASDKKRGRKATKSDTSLPDKVLKLTGLIADGITKLKQVDKNLFVESLLSKSSGGNRYTCLLALVMGEMLSKVTEVTEQMNLCLQQYHILHNLCNAVTGKIPNVELQMLDMVTTVTETCRSLEDGSVNPILGLSLLRQLISEIKIPETLQEGGFWQFTNDDGTEDSCLKLLVSLFNFLLEMSSADSVRNTCTAKYRELTAFFTQTLLSANTVFIFLGLLWTQHCNNFRDILGIDPVLQARALQLGKIHLQRLHKSKDIESQMKIVVMNLLLTLRSSHSGIRQIAIDCFETLHPVAKETDSVYLPMMKKVLHCQSEIMADPNYIEQMMFSVLRKVPDEQVMETPKKKARRSSKPQMKQMFLDEMVDIIVQQTTPAFVQNGLLSILKLYNNQVLLTKLQPALLTLLTDMDSGDNCALRFDSCRLLLERFTPDTVDVLAPDSSSCELFIKALNCEFCQPLSEMSIQHCALLQITQQFYGELSPDTQRLVLSSMFDVWLKSKNPNVPNIVRKVVKHVTLDGIHVGAELEKCVKTTSSTSVREAKRRKRQSLASAVVEQADEFEQPSWQRLTIIMEAIQDKKKINNYITLLPVVFTILSRVLDMEQHTSAEYIKQLLLSTVFHICSKASQSNEVQVLTAEVPEEKFNMELIVTCIRTSSNPQTHHQALLVLTMVAKIYPEKLLHNMMSVFTFMGANILRHDDAYSFSIITRILETVIPALVMACQQRRSIPRGVTNNIEDVITMVIRVFVDAHPHIPQHRQLMLFTKLVEIIGDNAYLWRCLLLLTENIVNKTPAAVDDKEKQKEEQDREVEFCLNLCAQFPVTVQLSSLVNIILYIAQLPDDKDDDSASKMRITPTSLGKLKKEDTELFNVKSHTAKQLRHFKYQSIQTLIALCTSHRFIAQLTENTEEDILPKFQSLLETVMQYITQLTTTVDKHSDQPTSKFWKALLHKVYDLLDKVVMLLPQEMFVEVIAGLLDHAIPNVQRRAMELLNNSLLQQKDVHMEQQRGHLLPLVDKLVHVVEKLVTIDESTEEGTVNGQTALYSLKLICRHIGAQNPHTFIKVLKLCVEIFTSKGDNVPVYASAILCIAEVCNSLKAHVIAHLSSFMPKILEILKLKKDQLMSNELYLLSVITAILKVVENLSLFLSPYLVDILHEVCCLSGDEEHAGIVQKPQIQQRLRAIRHTLATVLPPRVLIPAVNACYDRLSSDRVLCIEPLMRVLEHHISNLSKEDLNSHLQQLQAFILMCLEFRVNHKKGIPEEQVSQIEESIMDIVISLVMKLSEATFRPLLFKLFDWATRDEDTQYNVLVFYKLAKRLAEKLKSLFTIFAGHIVKHAAQVLDENNSSKTDTAYFGTGKKARRLSHQLLLHILDCLYNCFLYDTDGFVTKERFESLMQPLIDQIENVNKKTALYQVRVSEHLVPCIVQFAVAAQDDSLWKLLNYQVLLKTRHSSPKIRFAALTTVDELHRKLGEDYMPLLAETIPFLAELMEDESEEVEKKCHSVVSEMEKTLGEPLQKYF